MIASCPLGQPSFAWIGPFLAITGLIVFVLFGIAFWTMNRKL